MVAHTQILVKLITDRSQAISACRVRKYIRQILMFNNQRIVARFK